VNSSDQDNGWKRDYLGYGAHPPKVEWPNGARVALNLVVNYEEGSEYTFEEDGGRNETLAEIPGGVGEGLRDFCVESVYEYGSRAGIWRVLRLLDEYGVRSTFFASAVALQRNPEVAAWMNRAGHEPCSHGYRWEEVWRLGEDAEREHIRQAVSVFEEVCGRRPVGWYCRYGASQFTRRLLVEEGGFTYDSDAYNDDIPYYLSVDGKEHLILPYSLLYNDVRFVLPQGFGSPSDFVETCTRGIDYLIKDAGDTARMMSIGLHPRFIGQAARAWALEKVIEHALEAGVWIATREEIAGYWRENVPAGG
jgi:peptidoglycan/xylan/chitin deacetylase (PgdA/CDA1 family)